VKTIFNLIYKYVLHNSIFKPPYVIKRIQWRH